MLKALIALNMNKKKSCLTQLFKSYNYFSLTIGLPSASIMPLATSAFLLGFSFTFLKIFTKKSYSAIDMSIA